jgi:uncharacterized protein (TIGR00730 family)
MAKMPVKAYKNLDFLNSPAARTIRMLAEYLEPRSRFHKEKIRDTIVFFGSARFCDAETAAKRVKAAKASEQVRAAKRCEAGSHYYEDARRLAAMLTKWSMGVSGEEERFVVCSGGGPGIMEAANRGAADAGGRSIGLNISLPMEQKPNPYITPELSFDFHYFFMRKLWFAYMAKALIVFPGGYGTLDEMMEILTLSQTNKFRKKMLVMIYGSEYWHKVINFDAMVDMGTIDPEDLDLFRFANEPQQAYDLLTGWLEEHYPLNKDERPGGPAELG